MGKVKVSALPSVSSLNGSELTMVIQDSQNKKASVQAFLNYLGASGVMLQASRTLTSSEILNMHTPSIQVLAAPGSGYVYRVFSAEYFHVFGSTPYTRTNSAVLQMYYDTGRTLSVNMQTRGSFMTSSADSLSFALAGAEAGTSNIDVSAVSNKPIYITTAALNETFTLGNGQLLVIVNYKIIAVP